MPTDTVITIFESEYVTIWCHVDSKIIHHKFHKFLHGEDFRKAMLAGVEAMKTYSAHKWLSDDRLNSALPKDDQEWGNRVWFPKTQAAGWKYWAIVQPENVIGQMNIHRIAKTFTDQGVTTQFFSDPDEAMAWLKNQ